MSIPPETRYARNGAIHLAYQELGSGPPNLLVVQSGANTHVDYAWMEPSLARFMRRLASFSRLIVYDNRGVGLSDPVPDGAAPTMDEQVDDIRAVLDETGCRRAVLAGNLAGCAPALVFAATHPGRVESLILLGGYARLWADAGYPEGRRCRTRSRSGVPGRRRAGRTLLLAARRTGRRSGCPSRRPALPGSPERGIAGESTPCNSEHQTPDNRPVRANKYVRDPTALHTYARSLAGPGVRSA
jgi:pimeloyl-ACP methyl ester carboxylesterase